MKFTKQHMFCMRVIYKYFHGTFIVQYGIVILNQFEICNVTKTRFEGRHHCQIHKDT